MMLNIFSQAYLPSMCLLCEISVQILCPFKNIDLFLETSLAVQWLRLCASNARCMGLIPGLGTKMDMDMDL